MEVEGGPCIRRGQPGLTLSEDLVGLSLRDALDRGEDLLGCKSNAFDRAKGKMRSDQRERRRGTEWDVAVEVGGDALEPGLLKLLAVGH